MTPDMAPTAPMRPTPDICSSWYLFVDGDGRRVHPGGADGRSVFTLHVAVTRTGRTLLMSTLPPGMGIDSTACSELGVYIAEAALIGATMEGHARVV